MLLRQEPEAPGAQPSFKPVDSFCSVMSAHIQLAKARHMAKAKFRDVGKHAPVQIHKAEGKDIEFYYRKRVRNWRQ